MDSERTHRRASKRARFITAKALGRPRCLSNMGGARAGTTQRPTVLAALVALVVGLTLSLSLSTLWVVYGVYACWIWDCRAKERFTTDASHHTRIHEA